MCTELKCGKNGCKRWARVLEVDGNGHRVAWIYNGDGSMESAAKCEGDSCNGLPKCMSDPGCTLAADVVKALVS